MDLFSSLEIFLYRYPIIRWVFGLAVFSLFAALLFGQTPVLEPQQPAEIIAEQRVLQIMGFILCLLLLLIQQTPFVAKAIAFAVAVRGVPSYQGDEKHIYWAILCGVVLIRLWFTSSEASRHG